LVATVAPGRELASAKDMKTFEAAVNTLRGYPKERVLIWVT
jgi:hypothetical protein